MNEMKSEIDLKFLLLENQNASNIFFLKKKRHKLMNNNKNNFLKMDAKI